MGAYHLHLTLDPGQVDQLRELADRPDAAQDDGRVIGPAKHVARSVRAAIDGETAEPAGGEVVVHACLHIDITDHFVELTLGRLAAKYPDLVASDARYIVAKIDLALEHPDSAHMR